VTDDPDESKAANDGEQDTGSARALTLHLLRMFETRADAAGIAVQSEIQSFSERLQLRLIAAGAMFLAIWGGIVLLAIALPPHLRIPVLSVVVVGFIAGAVWAQLAAKRKVTSRGVGSMTWFLDGLRLDLEVLSRVLASSRTPPASAPAPEQRSPPSDIAA
jgi:uncharacterized membrane protein YqjE